MSTSIVESCQCEAMYLSILARAGYGTIFSLVTNGFHAEAIIRLKAKYQCSTLLNGTTAEALVLVGCVEFFFHACIWLLIQNVYSTIPGLLK